MYYPHQIANGKCSLHCVSSHGKPGKVMEFHFCFPGLEKSWKLTPGFGKFIKSYGNFKRHPLSIQGYIYVIRSNFGVLHIFLYCDWNLVHGSQRQKTPNHTSMACCIFPRGLGICLFHATMHVKGP